MYIYNTTFFIEQNSEDRFLSWLRPLIETKLCSEAGENPRLTRLFEIPGAAPQDDQPLSIALQVEFDDVGSARRWRESYLAPLVSEFERMFAPAAVSFSSLFETLPL